MTAHWHVLGAGAIGGLFAQRLMTMGHPTTVITRGDARGQQTLTFEADGRCENLALPHVSLAQAATIDHLLVCTKAFDIVPAVKAALPKLAPNAVVVLLANGMGYHETVADLLNTQQLIAGSTTAGCYKPAADHWRVVSDGQTRLGNWSREGAYPAVLEPWLQQSWSCVWEANIHTVLLEKVLINAAINPPTALYNIANGALLSPEYRGEFEAALSELDTWLAALSGACDTGGSFRTVTAPLDDRTHLETLRDGLAARIKAVAEATAANTSSMRADYQLGRRTEIDAILGYLLKDTRAWLPARQVAPPTPILSRWLHIVQQRDSHL